MLDLLSNLGIKKRHGLAHGAGPAAGLQANLRLGGVALSACLATGVAQTFPVLDDSVSQDERGKAPKEPEEEHADSHRVAYEHRATKRVDHENHYLDDEGQDADQEDACDARL